MKPAHLILIALLLVPARLFVAGKDFMHKPRAELLQLARERITFPLACYLVAAETNVYFCYTWGYCEMHGTVDWYPEFDNPLGPPLGAA